MIAYYKLMDVLARRGMKKIDLQRALNISPTTMASLSKNRPVNLSLIDKICKYLDCQPGDIIEYIPDENDSTKKD